MAWGTLIPKGNGSRKGVFQNLCQGKSFLTFPTMTNETNIVTENSYISPRGILTSLLTSPQRPHKMNPMSLIRILQRHRASLRFTLPAGACQAYNWNQGDRVTITFNPNDQSITLKKLKTYASKNNPKNDSH